MDRSAASDWLIEVVKRSSRPIHLISFEFDDAAVRHTDAYRSVTYNSEVYTAQGHLLNIEGMEESSPLFVPQVKITLANANQQWIANILNNVYIDRRIRIYKAFIGAGEVLVTPLEVFDGFMDAAAMEENPDAGESIVVITASRYGSDIQRRPGRHCNNSEHQLFAPGDKFFEFTEVPLRNTPWGVSSPVPGWSPSVPQIDFNVGGGGFGAGGEGAGPA